MLLSKSISQTITIRIADGQILLDVERNRAHWAELFWHPHTAESRNGQLPLASLRMADADSSSQNFTSSDEGEKNFEKVAVWKGRYNLLYQCGDAESWW